jgi:hypothetical protein
VQAWISLPELGGSRKRPFPRTIVEQTNSLKKD